jgi:Polyketide cyclase / dehydrase and lipid transport
MPSFSLSSHTRAPIEEVWKLIHDPSRFPEWWAGVETVQPGADGEYTMWPAGYPDFPMAQHLNSEHGSGRVTISCLVSDLEFRWQLREAPDGTGIEVHVLLPEQEAHRLPAQRAILAESLDRLAALALTTAS